MGLVEVVIVACMLTCTMSHLLPMQCLTESFSYTRIGVLVLSVLGLTEGETFECTKKSAPQLLIT